MKAIGKALPSAEFILAIIFIFALFVFIWPRTNFTPHVPNPAHACINNLRQIDAAAQEFAFENHRTNGEAINFPNDLTPYIKLGKDGKIPPCLQGGVYSIKKVGEPPTCSLSNTVTPAHVLP